MDNQFVWDKGKYYPEFDEYFTGITYVNRLLDEPLNIGCITFEPGVRNHWHAHTASKGGGQILICVSGTGWYQEWGKPARKLHAGDIVNIPAGVRHWHGAAKDSCFQHLAVAVPGEDTGSAWFGPVSDEEYNALEDLTIRKSNDFD